VTHLRFYNTERRLCGAEDGEDTIDLEEITCMACYDIARKRWWF
jgi:hypothetical protein